MWLKAGHKIQQLKNIQQPKNCTWLKSLSTAVKTPLNENNVLVCFQGVQAVFSWAEKGEVPVHMQGVPADIPMDQKWIRTWLQINSPLKFYFIC